MIEVRQDEFDSRHFGKRVYKAWVHGDAVPAAMFDDLHAETADIVFAFTACTFRNAAAMHGLGFDLVSVRSTYEADAREIPCAVEPPAGVSIRRLSEGRPTICADDLRLLADTVGRTSRYFRDENVPRAVATRIYVEWLENSLYRGYAPDAVLAFAGERLVGVNTLRFHGEAGTIDLIGVVPGSQGGGVGRALLCEGVRICRERGATTIRVVTEAENVAACRFYQRHRFLLTATELVWHRHAAPAEPGARSNGHAAGAHNHQTRHS